MTARLYCSSPLCIHSGVHVTLMKISLHFCALHNSQKGNRILFTQPNCTHRYLQITGLFSQSEWRLLSPQGQPVKASPKPAMAPKAIWGATRVGGIGTRESMDKYLDKASNLVQYARSADMHPKHHGFNASFYRVHHMRDDWAMDCSGSPFPGVYNPKLPSPSPQM